MMEIYSTLLPQNATLPYLTSKQISIGLALLKHVLHLVIPEEKIDTVPLASDENSLRPFHYLAYPIKTEQHHVALSLQKYHFLKDK